MLPCAPTLVLLCPGLIPPYASHKLIKVFINWLLIPIGKHGYLTDLAGNVVILDEIFIQWLSLSSCPYIIVFKHGLCICTVPIISPCDFLNVAWFLTQTALCNYF